MKDFTFKIYTELLETFLKSGYVFYTFESFIENNIQNGTNERVIVLRHDVDRKPEKSLQTALIEHDLSIRASYYFRIVKASNKPEIIKKIEGFGHEIGYHYEDLAMAKGDYDKAIASFERNLEYFRKFYPVRTMCMHGSPMSKWDNRKLWAKHDYKKYVIIAEPYFDLDFNKVFYITDASRTWNNTEVTRRDKVKTNFNFGINSIFDIMELLKENKLPSKILLNIHPQNWTDNKMEWYKILLWQSIKNLIKKNLK